MAISRKAALKYQGNQNIGEGQGVSYSLPPTKKVSSTNSLPITKQSEISFIRSDLIKTILVATGIMILELLVWWKLK